MEWLGITAAAQHIGILLSIGVKDIDTFDTEFAVGFRGSR